MKSNINISPLRTWSDIPEKWHTRPRTAHYKTLSPSTHYADGWRDVVSPPIGENQKFGGLYFNEANDVVTWHVVDFTLDQIKANFQSRIQSKQSEILESEKQRQAMATFQAIETEAEAFEVKEVFPSWDEKFDYLTVTAQYKVTRVLPDGEGGFELSLFFLIQPHTPAIGDTSYYPENAPALWSRVIIGDGGVEVWTQPTGGDGKYPYLDPSTGQPYRVTHNGKLWENNVTGTTLNVWVPGEYGWTEIT